MSLTDTSKEKACISGLLPEPGGGSRLPIRNLSPPDKINEEQTPTSLEKISLYQSVSSPAFTPLLHTCPKSFWLRWMKIRIWPSSDKGRKNQLPGHHSPNGVHGVNTLRHPGRPEDGGFAGPEKVPLPNLRRYHLARGNSFVDLSCELQILNTASQISTPRLKQHLKHYMT